MNLKLINSLKSSSDTNQKDFDEIASVKYNIAFENLESSPSSSENFVKRNVMITNPCFGLKQDSILKTPDENNQACNIKMLSSNADQLKTDETVFFFFVRDVKGDGNCLFRCLSLYLYGDENEHKTIRKEIVDFVCKHWAKYKDHIEASCSPEDEKKKQF